MASLLAKKAGREAVDSKEVSMIGTFPKTKQGGGRSLGGGFSPWGKGEATIKKGKKKE